MAFLNLKREEHVQRSEGPFTKNTQRVTRNQLQSLIQETGALLPRRSPDQWSSDSTQDMWSKHISKTGVRTYINYTSWLDQRHPSPNNPKKPFRNRHDINTCILQQERIFNMMLDGLFCTAFSLQPFNASRRGSKATSLALARRRKETPQRQQLRSSNLNCKGWEPNESPQHDHVIIHPSLFLGWGWGMKLGWHVLVPNVAVCRFYWLQATFQEILRTDNLRHQIEDTNLGAWFAACCLQHTNL